MADDPLVSTDPIAPGNAGATMPLPPLTPAAAPETPPAVPPPTPTPPTPVPPAATAPAEEKPKSLSDQLIEQQIEREKRAIKREDAATERTTADIEATRASNARTEELTRRQMEVQEQGAKDLHDINQQQLKLMQDRPQPMMPTPPPHPHYTMPPGLFGNQNSPGNGWANAMSVFSGISPQGLMGGNIVAIKAMTGMLEGWHQGEQDKFNLEYKNWQEANNYIKEYNATVRDSYTQKLEDNKMAFEVKKGEIEMNMLQYKDAIGLEILQKQGMQGVSDLLDKRDKQMDEADKHAADFIKTVDAHEKAQKTAQQTAGARRAAELWLDQGIKPASRGTAFNEAVYEAITDIGRERGWDDATIDRHLRDAQVGLAADTAGERSIGLRVANMELAQRDVAALIKPALEASAAVSRTGFVPVDRAIQAWQSGTNDVALTRFAMINFQLDEILARSVKPQGVLDVALQQQLQGRIHTAQSQEAYATALDTVVQAITREYNAGKAQLGHQPFDVPDVPGAYRPPPLGTTPAAPAASGTSHGVPWSVSP